MTSIILYKLYKNIIRVCHTGCILQGVLILTLNLTVQNKFVQLRSTLKLMPPFYFPTSLQFVNHHMSGRNELVQVQIISLILIFEQYYFHYFIQKRYNIHFETFKKPSSKHKKNRVNFDIVMHLTYMVKEWHLKKIGQGLRVFYTTLCL